MSGIKISHLKIFLTAAFILTASYFFRPVFVSIQILKGIYALLLLTITFVTFQKRRQKKGKFVFDVPIKLTIISIVFSILPAYYAWGQSKILTAISLLPYLAYFLYFFLITVKPNIKKIETLIIQFALLSVFLLVFAIVIYPHILYGLDPDTETNLDRGFARISIGCEGFIFLGFFLSINKYVTSKKTKWITLSLFLLLGIFLTLTRQLIIWTIIITILFLLRRLTTMKRIALLSLIVAATIFISKLDFINRMTEQTIMQSKNWKGDVRVLSASYFLFKFSPDWLTKIFGNGEATIGKGNYGKEMLKLKSEGYYQSDIGFIGFYSKFGLLVIIAWIMVFYRMYKLKLPSQFHYLKLYILLILLTGFTSSPTFSIDFISSICIALYLAEYAHVKQTVINAAVLTLHSDVQNAVPQRLY